MLIAMLSFQVFGVTGLMSYGPTKEAQKMLTFTFHKADKQPTQTFRAGERVCATVNLKENIKTTGKTITVRADPELIKVPSRLRVGINPLGGCEVGFRCSPPTTFCFLTDTYLNPGKYAIEIYNYKTRVQERSQDITILAPNPFALEQNK